MHLICILNVTNSERTAMFEKTFVKWIQETFYCANMAFSENKRSERESHLKPRTVVLVASSKTHKERFHDKKFCWIDFFLNFVREKIVNLNMYWNAANNTKILSKNLTTSFLSFWKTHNTQFYKKLNFESFSAFRKPCTVVLVLPLPFSALKRKGPHTSCLL